MTVTWAGKCTDCNAEVQVVSREATPQYSKTFEVEKCPNCGTSESLTMTVKAVSTT
jgi:uncharacterized protein with PIN domain